jgi:hypothetical protein
VVELSRRLAHDESLSYLDQLGREGSFVGDDEYL